MKLGLIEFTRYPAFSPGEEVLVGRLELGATIGITQTEKEQRIEVWRIAKNEIRRKIWHNVYGDVMRSIRELRTESVICAKDQYTAESINDKFAAIEALLEYPDIADETPDATNMVKIKKGHAKRASP